MTHCDSLRSMFAFTNYKAISFRATTEGEISANLLHVLVQNEVN